MSKLVGLLLAHASIVVCSILLTASVVAAALGFGSAGEIAKLVLVGVVGVTTFVVTRHLAEALKALSGIELMAGIVVGLVLSGVGASIGIDGAAGMLDEFVGTFVGSAIGFVAGFTSIFCLSAGARYLVAVLSRRP
jgi:hypothetical protein